MANREGSSSMYPIPRLQFVQSNPRTAPVSWLWSTWNADHLPPGEVDLQIEQPPPCLPSRSSYWSAVNWYCAINRPRLAPPFNWKRRCDSRIFSGLRAAHVSAGLERHLSQQVETIVLLLAFGLKALTGNFSRHFLHVFIRPFYANQ